MNQFAWEDFLLFPETDVTNNEAPLFPTLDEDSSSTLEGSICAEPIRYQAIMKWKSQYSRSDGVSPTDMLETPSIKQPVDRSRRAPRKRRITDREERNVASKRRRDDFNECFNLVVARVPECGNMRRRRDGRNAELEAVGKYIDELEARLAILEAKLDNIDGYST
jgi:hypothetical protein